MRFSSGFSALPALQAFCLFVLYKIKSNQNGNKSKLETDTNDVLRFCVCGSEFAATTSVITVAESIILAASQLLQK